MIMKSSNILVPPVTSITTLGVKKKVNRRNMILMYVLDCFHQKGILGIRKPTHVRVSTTNMKSIMARSRPKNNGTHFVAHVAANV